ncbi:hypothetical protein FRC12_006766 [Ceratobasidium sp. 428]|nr:hypothetical protein FRC12_006766 [Ceratobasidium sp. 428]
MPGRPVMTENTCYIRFSEAIFPGSRDPDSSPRQERTTSAISTALCLGQDMLTKVKRQLFSRNRKPGPLLVQFAVKVRDDTPQRQLEEDGTQELIAVLTETFHALGPLTPAVYGFLKLIETLEVEILYSHKELWDGLNDSFRALSDYLSGVADSSRLPSIGDLIR